MLAIGDKLQLLFFVMQDRAPAVSADNVDITTITEEAEGSAHGGTPQSISHQNSKMVTPDGGAGTSAGSVVVAAAAAATAEEGAAPQAAGAKPTD